MKIIEVHQPDLIICDNPNCGYKIPNESGDPNTETKQYINIPCPECGENLLTEKDYLNGKRINNVVNKINKYFGWLGFFSRKKEMKTYGTIHAHDGIKIDINNER